MKTYNETLIEHFSSREAATGAFGSQVNTELTPLFQAVVQYNKLLDAKIETFTASGGTAEATGGEFHCQTGTSSGGYGVIRSNRPLVYRAGQALRCMWTQRIPTAGVGNSTVWGGAFNVTDTLAVGYHNGTFGLLHQHHGVVEVRTLTVSAGASGTESVTINVNGTASTFNVTSGDANFNAYEIAKELTADSNQSDWYFTQNGATVKAVSRSTGAKSSTFDFTNNAAGTCAASWAQDTAGADKTTVHTAMTSWDNPPTIDQTKGNLWMLVIPYLGYGNPKLYAENRNTGNMELVHTYKWADRNTQPLFSNPSLRVGFTAASLGSTTDLDIYGASLAAFAEGIIVDDIPARAADLFADGTVTTTKQVFWSGRCRREFNGIINASEVLPKRITVSTDSSKPITVEIYKNLTTTNDQDWSYVDEDQSITEVEQTAIAYSNFTGGRLVASDSCEAGVKADVDMKALGQYLAPGETMSIALTLSSGGTGQDAVISADWEEDV